jgi:hypothetical protein
MLAISSGLNESKTFKRIKCYLGFKEFLFNLFILFLLSLVGAVVELIIISFIFRPLNFLF